jgi:outer membrane biosynthesis protein TonB
MDGGAKRKGYAAYDAENSPIGRYRKELSAAIERAWQMRMLASRDFMDFNTKIRVEFSVNRWGKIKNLRVPKRANNAVLTNETLSAIIEAKIPEMPAAVQEELDGGDLPCFYNFRIH